MTGRQYTAAPNPASAAIDQLVCAVRDNPAQLTALSFDAANVARRDGLGLFVTANRLIGAALTAGLTEAFARREVNRGFAAARHEEADS